MSGKLWRWMLLAAVALGPAASLMAEVTLPKIFGDGMVLQRDMPIPVWGHAAPGEKISITLAGHQAAATADARGAWMVKLPAMKAGGPYVLKVGGTNAVEFKDVLIGEVWICSGQSNMEWTVGALNDPKREIAEANYPMIRQFRVSRLTAPIPQADVARGGPWETCTPPASGGFTAVGYFFARELHQKLGVPIGLINNSWSGMTIEPYIPRDALEHVPGMADRLAVADEAARIAGVQQPSLDAKVLAHRKTIAEAIAVEADDAVARKMADPALDTSGWKEMKIPGNWKASGLADYDGVVWFRKTVDIPAAWEGKELSLNLGPIDETDVTWFNGVEVGRTGSLVKNDYLNYWNVPRKYTVPGSAVRAGKATIAVRVVNTAFAGGIWSEKEEKINLLPAGDAAAEPLPLNGAWQYQPVQQIVSLPAPTNEVYATSLWNAMVNPLVPYAIRGAIWYQGESNLDDGLAYTAKMNALISGWRQAWGEGDFPFYYVQLAPYKYGEDGPEKLPLMWEAQSAALAIPNTGMACTVDIGEPANIHPQKKAEVGHRLALWALARTYGQNKIVYRGPMYKSVEFKDGKAVVKLDHVEGGLASRDGKDLSWFTIAGADKKFVPAQARIDGGAVVVWSENVPKPTAVRFAWDQVAQPNLMNAEGLPAVPFRTDAP